jgi:lipopolysaccharide/colanic/teichoic acid biosynthesis glycosyltransferase
MLDRTHLHDMIEQEPIRHSFPDRLQAKHRLGVEKHRKWIDSDFCKRAFDIAGASFLLLFLSPAMLIIAAILYLRYGAHVFYAHERIGQKGRQFGCLKFRTMRLNAEAILQDCLDKDPAMQAEWTETFKLRNDPRVLPIGHFLRKSSLDELPQLWNVLRGEMSLVGPRPITEAESASYGSDFVYYLAVRPGITGPWQVSGRSLTTYSERVALDKRYAQERTFALDILILLRTVKVVLRGDGAC